MILRTFPVISGLWLNPVGVRLLEVFTLTPASSAGQALTLSLKGEGISGLRKSYPDRSQAVGQDAFTPSAGPGQVQPSGCTGWRLAVALACWRGDRRKKRFSMPFRAAPTRRRDQGCVRGWSYSRGLGVGWGCGSSCSWRSWDIREPQWLYGFRPVAKGWGFA